MAEKIIYQATKPKRSADPQGMRFQQRDGEILQAIYQHDGVLARRQLKEMFWCGTSQRAMEKRLAKLHHGGYIDWPMREQWRSRAIPEAVCWLGWKGVLWLAGMKGVYIKEPVSNKENQLRRLEKELRE